MKCLQNITIRSKKWQDENPYLISVDDLFLIYWVFNASSPTPGRRTQMLDLDAQTNTKSNQYKLEKQTPICVIRCLPKSIYPFILRQYFQLCDGEKGWAKPFRVGERFLNPAYQ